VADWISEGLATWRAVAREHARLRPCPPAAVPTSTSARRATVTHELGIENRAIVVFLDYAGRTITATAAMLRGKLAVDVDHARFAGWVRATLVDPIEVWDRIDRAEDAAPKRHYFSAYHDGMSDVISYMAVAVAADGAFVTAYPKAGSLDGRRNGELVFLCYPRPSIDGV
jgi:Barnase-EndoU-ColicinE5/D-RelE like nuclease